MRYTAAENSGAMYWSEDGVGYVLSGPIDKDRLNQVARLVYDQTEKSRWLNCVQIASRPMSQFRH